MPPRFCPSVFIQYGTRKWKSAKNGEGLGTPITWMTSGGQEVDVGGMVPDYKYGRNKPESEFLTGQAEYSWSCERLVSCLMVERSMMKSSTLFHIVECGPYPPMSTLRPPDIIHVIGVPRPSPFFALFGFHVLYLMQTEEKKWGRPGNEATKGYTKSP